MIRTSTFLTAAALATLIAVGPALLQPTSVSAEGLKYVGAHTVVDGDDPFDWVSGGQGVLDFNRRCAAAFEGAQMCESIDILRSGSLPDDAAQAAGIHQWVKPTIVQIMLDPENADLTLVVDASGIVRRSVSGLSCDGWSTSATNHFGLTMQGNGKFSATSCHQEEFYAVACCAATSGKKK